MYVPAKKIAHRKIGETVVLVNIEDNKMIRLNETGSEIWSCLDGRSIEQIADHLCEQFSVSQETARADTAAFLELMRSRGLVEPFAKR